jgi:hypothetical protein
MHLLGREKNIHGVTLPSSPWFPPVPWPFYLCSKTRTEVPDANAKNATRIISRIKTRLKAPQDWG